MDWTKNTALFIGRFQPWKKAHFEIVKQAMQRGDLATPTDRRTSNARQIMIMVRCVEVNDKNPYTFRDIKKMITKDLSLEYPHRFEIIEVPNIQEHKNIVEKNNKRGICVLIDTNKVKDIHRDIYELLFCIPHTYTMSRTKDNSIIIINCEHEFWNNTKNFKEYIIKKEFCELWPV